MALLGVVVAGATHAAADPDLIAAGASTTDFFTDNKSTIISTFITIVIAITIIGVSIALALRAKRMAVGSVAGGRRRR